MIGTPGRISDLVEKKKLSLMDTQILVIDDADKFFEAGFDNELKVIMS
jgi:superfamily II DNA/RNA helicase